MAQNVLAAALASQQYTRMGRSCWTCFLTNIQTRFLAKNIDKMEGVLSQLDEKPIHPTLPKLLFTKLSKINIIQYGATRRKLFK